MRAKDQGAGPCLNDVGFVGGVGANTSAIFGDRSERAELRDAQTMARVGIEGCVGFSRTVSTNPCNTSLCNLPARASPTGEGGRSDADRSSRHKSSKDLEVIRGRKVEGFDRPTVWARSRPFPRLCRAARNSVSSSGSSICSLSALRAACINLRSIAARAIHSGVSPTWGCASLYLRGASRLASKSKKSWRRRMV